MGDDKEVRITQMKMVMENNKVEKQLELERLRHKDVMEELKIMAENKIVSFNLTLSDKQIKRINKKVQEGEHSGR